MTVIVQGVQGVLQPTNTVKTKKKVRFHPSINMNGHNQKEQKRLATLEIILDLRYENQLVSLSGYSRMFLNFLINQQGRYGNNPDPQNLRTLLQEFRDTGRNTLEAFNEEESHCIDSLAGTPGFYNMFQDCLPSSVVSSPESISENSNGERRGEEKREREQEVENISKALVRSFGPDERNE